ncbi:T9SS type A sorting domain-containing protein [Flavipsychrobacter stenotrophus]|nr:T9SS type A sorting domain-containing protein [Flavipsychrobacter stenotrophus]
MAATTASGNTNIRGYVSGAAVSTVAAVPVFNNITVNNGTTSTVAFAPSTGAATYTLIGSLNIASTGTGALLLNPNTINIGGNFTHTSSTNAFTAGTSTVIFNGAAPQTYTTNVVAGNTFNNLTINNGSTITLNGIINVTNTIGLINGVFVTGSGAVSLSSAATVSGGGTSSYVKGNLFKAMPAAGTTSMTYQVGDLTYSPVKLTFSSSINSGSITVKSTSGAHPSMSGSYVDASAAVNRYWTITPAGVAPSTVNIDFSYNNGDIAGGGANGGFILRQYSGSTWSTMPFVSNSTSGTAPLLPNVTTTTGTSGASFSGDYVVGNALCSTPSGGTTAATSTTVCSGSSTTLSLSGASANSAITYQWQSSPDGIVAYTNISGATSASYSVTPASTTFYKCQVTCQLTSNTALSAPITINTGTAPSSVSASISATTICDGSNISLVGSATGATSYSWNGPGGYTSTNLNPASFTVNTASSGVYTLSATNSCGTYTAPTAALIVYATPTAVTATAASTALCSGNGLVLNGTASGASNYSWAGPDSYSSTDLNPASITVGTASAGVYTLTATNICGTLTATTASVTVSPVPFAVIATASATTLCAGNVLTLTGSASSATSYSWNGPNGFTSSLLNPSSFTVGTASAGSYTFTATNSCGSNTASVTVAVNAAPTSITASPSATTLCAGTTLTLTGSAVGATSYVWNGPGGYFAPTAVASFAIGTANAGSYTLTATNSCGSTTVATTSLSVTGTPTVAAISATATTVGIGGTLTLSDATPSGTWSSTNAAIATVSPSGVVTGIGAGAATISYAVSGSCGVNAATQSVLVTPSAIELVGWNVSTMPGGTNNFGSSPLSPTTTASNITLPQTLTRGTGIGTTGSGAARGWGGTDWQNSTVANAVTGNDIVTFSMKADAGYAVNLSSCTIAYRRSGTGPGNGELQYSIDGTNFSTVVALSYPTTSSGGNTISGINLSSIASLQNVPSSTTVTFRIVNYGGTAAAGTWYLFDVANTPASDFFIQGSVVCSGTPAAGTVAVTGTSTFCNSGATSLTFTPGVSSTGTSYQWSSSNDVASTSFTPISGATSGSYTTGTLTDTTYYNVATTCSYSGLTATTTNATITVNPLPVTPAAITGATTVCAGSTVTLFDATSGGTWTSVTPGVATISSAGVVSAVSAGTTVISYTMSTPSCGSASATTTLTVNALPSAGTVTGPVSVCVSTSSPFTNTATGGTWSTSDVAIATVSASGTVYGVASGSVIISYTNTNGCGTAYDTMMIAINTSASAGVISGTTSICLGTSSTLSDGIPGGTWSSVNNSVATITSTGIVTGVTADTVTIAYTVNTSCGTAVATTVVTVNPILSAPPAITGTLSVCPAATTTLSDLASGGTWTTSDPSIATINSVGMVTGVTSGSATITYTINNLCGSAYITTPFTVNPLPVVGAITGSATVCNGSSASLSDITSGGVWTSGSPAIASVNSSTGVVSGLTLGNATIAYAVTNSCGTTTVNRSVSVITVPVLSTITGATMVYNGASTTLSDTATSGAWTSNNPSIATVGATGIVTGSSLGTTTITYSATNSCGTAFVTSPMTVLTPVSAAAAFWNFTVGSGSTSQATSSSSTNVLASNCIASVGNVNGTVTAISSTSASTTLSGYSGGNNIGNAAFTGTLSSTSSYIQFTLTPNSGYFINISGMSFAYRGTGTGPQAYTIKTSADGYSSAVATGSLSNTSTWLTATPTFASSITGGSSTSLTVRVYGHSGTGSPGASTINWRMDDVNINFTANQNICSGTPAAGTAAITGPAATCGTGSTSLTFTPGVNALGTTYQWSESNSATGSFTPIAGATSAVYTTPTLTDTAYYVTTTTCNYSGLSANTAVNTVNINALPTIALSAAMPTVCQPTTSAPVSFSASTGSPTTYSINWNATADSAGFTDVTGATLSGSSLPLVMPATGAVGTFTGSLTVSNGMCTSAPYTVTTNILAYPTATVTSLDVPCIGHSGVVYVTGTPSDAIWYMVDSGTIINTTISAGGTFTISTGVISTPHNYSIVSVANAVCTTYVDTVVYVNPTPMQWIGGSAGHLTDWNYAGNWACNTVPTISDNVTVDSGTYIPIISGPTAVNALDLKLGQGATLVLNTGAVLNVKGMIDNNGTVSGDGRVIMNNTTSQIIKGRGTISNLELNNASGAAVDSGARLVISNTLYITSGTLTTSDSLELASSDSVTTARIAELPAVGGSISGKVKVDQYVQGHYRRFRFWSHPFDAALSLSQIQSFIDITGPGGSVNGFRSTSSNAPSAFRLDPYTENDTLGYDPGWKPFTKINAFAADSNKVQPYQGIRLFFRGKKGEGLGYLGYLGMYNPSATTVKMLGNINQGPQTAFMQQGHLDPDHQSFNMMGNPYPSPIDIGEVIWRAAQSGNVQGAAFYVWDPTLSAGGNFITIPIGTTSPVHYNISANTCFQVRAGHDGDSLNFVESDKVSSFDNYLFKAPSDYLTLNVYDSNYHIWDALNVQFNDKATDIEDSKFDAVKQLNADFTFYSLSADKRKLAIDARPFEAEKVVPLGISSAYDQRFIIRADNLAVPKGTTVFLNDKLLNKLTELKPGTEYAFTITKDKATQGDARFELSLKAATAPTDNGLHVTMTPNPASDDVHITFTTTQKENVSVRVMDISGVNVYNKDLGVQQNGTVNVSLSNLAAGIYMVELTSGDKKVLHRLVKE